MKERQKVLAKWLKTLAIRTSRVPHATLHEVVRPDGGPFNPALGLSKSKFSVFNPRWVVLPHVGSFDLPLCFSILHWAPSASRWVLQPCAVLGFSDLRWLIPFTLDNQGQCRRRKLWKRHSESIFQSLPTVSSVKPANILPFPLVRPLKSFPPRSPRSHRGRCTTRHSTTLHPSIANICPT